MDGIHCAQFIFYNDFDSANLLRVESVPLSESAVTKQSSNTSNNNKTIGVEIVDAEFNIWTKPDCYGTEFENGNRTWFYFGIKGPRTHPTQWAAIVEFIENHPEMVTHKFVGINGKENYIKLWEELTTQLNSMGFGKKDSKKWQEVFGKWKSKVKGKAQDIVCGMKKTGGGGPLPELNQIEERLMAIIGWKLVTGDENKEMGVENIFTSHDDITKEITEEAKNPENVFPNSNDITIKLTEEAEKISENKKYTTFSSTLPTMLKDVDLEMPPLTLLSKPSSTSMNKTVSNCNVSLISPVLRTNKDIVNETTPKTFAEKGTKRKLKHSSSPKKVPRQNQPHLVNMHNENIDVLKNINSNLTRIADSQEKQLELFAEILKVLKQK